MIHMTKPLAARRKWLKISGGTSRVGTVALLWAMRIPPLLSQRPSIVNPREAVRIQVMSAAIAMELALRCRGRVEPGGLGVFVGHTDAVLEGEFAAKVPGDAKRGDADGRHDD